MHPKVWWGSVHCDLKTPTQGQQTRQKQFLQIVESENEQKLAYVPRAKECLYHAVSVPNFVNTPLRYVSDEDYLCLIRHIQTDVSLAKKYQQTKSFF